MKNKVRSYASEGEKEFVKKFDSLCGERNAWEVWTDFVKASACALANSIDDVSSETYKSREEEYATCIKHLGGVQVPGEMLGIVAMELERNPKQDFLGRLFMTLELFSHWKGQFFTPYSLCELMADVTTKELEDKAAKQSYVTVNDCACGAGATLIAMANKLRDIGINYQQKAVFVAQDIDRVVGLMCYIQLSLLGCPGYVVIADTLTNPVVGSTLNPVQQEGQEFWFMPMFNQEIWRYRRIIDRVNESTSKPVAHTQLQATT